MGVGCAALLTGLLIDQTGWRTAFWLPGLISFLFGLVYLFSYWDRLPLKNAETASVNKPPSKNTQQISSDEWRAMLIRVTGIIFFTTAVAGIVFQGSTFALPKVFEERLGGIASTATMLGWLTFIVFAVASFSQLVVGKMLDTHGPRKVFNGVDFVQVFFFNMMPVVVDLGALAVSVGFMLGLLDKFQSMTT